jgi:N-methylhydantoinase A
MDVRVGVDVGGTFTDFVVLSADGLGTFKVPTSRPQSDAIVEALSKSPPDGHLSLFHGTTVATNALIEGTGAEVALVTDEGFEDLIEIGRQKRPSLYDTAASRPGPLVSRDRRIGHRDVESTLASLRKLDPEAVAIGFLGSFRDASAEEEVADAINEAFPRAFVSVSSRVSPGFREYERLETTVVNAYLTPLVSGYLEELDSSVDAIRKFVMTSSGGMLPFHSARDVVGRLTLSGPAGGVVAGQAVRDHHRFGDAISFDMGGTSTDVARLGRQGAVHAPSQSVAGRVNRVPSMPIHTVGAGGGSLGWLDPGGALRVGPTSAGANPGPASYGLGGTEATVTDANVHLGFIPTLSEFTGISVDRDLASRALSRLGANGGMSTDQVAWGMLEVIDAHMERAIRKVSVEEGFDPRNSVLIAFGGAGGLHASRLARRLDMRSVAVPPHAGVFSATGLLLASPRVEIVRTVLVGSDSPGLPEAGASIQKAAFEKFREMHGSKPTGVEVVAEARYAGQSHELAITYQPESVRGDFDAAHEGRFGFRLEGAGVEVVNLRGVATGAAPATWRELGVDAGPDPERRSTVIRHGPDGQEVDVWLRPTMPPGFSAEGQCLIVDQTATVLVGVGETASVLDDGTLMISW